MQYILTRIHEELRIKTNKSLLRINIELFDSSGLLRSHALSDIGSTYKSNLVFDYKSHYSKTSFQSDAYCLLEDNEYISIVDDFRYEPTKENASKEERSIINGLIESSLLSGLRMSILYRKKIIGFIYFNSNEIGFFSHSNRLDIFKIALEDIRIEIAFYLESIRSIHLVCNSYISALKSKYHNISSDDGKIDSIRCVVSYLVSRNKDYLKLSSKLEYELIEFSPLHDIGKIAIPDKILFKEFDLTKDEFDIIKTHPEIGFEIVKNIIDNIYFCNESKNLIKNIILYHHEKLNGTGYPFGLFKDEIPVEARVLAVADIYDALTTKRTYKRRFTHQEAMIILKNMASENEIDSVLVDSLNDIDLYLEKVKRSRIYHVL